MKFHASARRFLKATPLAAILIAFGSCLSLSLLATPAPHPQQPPAQQPPPAAGPESPAPIAPQKAPPSDGVGAAIDPHKYILGPGDVIFLRTWREPDFTMPLAIRPDGKITLPLVGEVAAAGLTPQDLTKDLTDRLGKYINNPDVTIIVQEIRSKKYYIDGEVGRPGVYPLGVPTTVLEALSSAGGFKEFANTKKIKILRNGKTLNFNWKEVTNGKHLEQNIELENGDHIIVH